MSSNFNPSMLKLYQAGLVKKHELHVLHMVVVSPGFLKVVTPHWASTYTGEYYVSQKVSTDIKVWRSGEIFEVTYVGSLFMDYAIVKVVSIESVEIKPEIKTAYIKTAYIKTGFGLASSFYLMNNNSEIYNYDSFCKPSMKNWEGLYDLNLEINRYFEIKYTGDLNGDFDVVSYEQYSPYPEEKWVEVITGACVASALYFDSDILPENFGHANVPHGDFEGKFHALGAYQLNFNTSDFDLETSTRYFMIYTGEIGQDDFEVIDFEPVDVEDEVEEVKPLTQKEMSDFIDGLANFLFGGILD